MTLGVEYPGQYANGPGQVLDAFDRYYASRHARPVTPTQRGT